VCTIFYILVSGVMVGLVPYKQMLGQAAPMVVAIRAAEAASGGSSLLHMMTMLVELGAIAGLSSVMVVMMMAQPRIFYSMANDGRAVRARAVGARQLRVDGGAAGRDVVAARRLDGNRLRDLFRLRLFAQRSAPARYRPGGGGRDAAALNGRVTASDRSDRLFR